MEKYTYHCQTMHIHTCHQPGSSMEAHMYNARELGMRYIRFTDHDTRTGPLPGRVHHFDFTLPEEQKAVWTPEGDAAVTLGDGALTVSAEAGEEPVQGRAVLSAPGKLQTVSLLAEVTLTLELTATVTGEAGFAIDLQLSQRPPDHQPAHLCYIQGQPPADLPPHSVCIPLTPDEDGVYRLAVSADAEKYGGDIGGVDNAYNFPGVRVWAAKGGRAECRLTRYDMQTVYGFEDVLRRQRAVAAEIGKRYGIKPYITTEISGAGQHKNYYGEQVPCIDYEARGYAVTQEEAIAHVKAHGGIFCYNHPFENGFYKKNKFPAEELPARVEMEADTLIESRVYGATLMEVGFPQGRGQFTHADHMRLWDRLSLAGVFITGCGDSDSHESHVKWFTGNNFASWIAAPAAMPHPVPDAVFIASMKAGRLYAGDPVQLKTPLSFTAEGKPMGAIIPIGEGDDRPREMVFSADCLPEGWRVRLIDSGECAGEYTVTEAGPYTVTLAVSPTRPVSFGRVELYNAEGRCVGLTNPIYLVRTAEYPLELPKERLYEEAFDKQHFEKPWPHQLDLPEGIKDIKGKTLLHIGDTESYYYPYFFKLIEEVKPDILLHTGDMADEVKVGRIPGTKHEYLAKIRMLIEKMRQAGTERLIIVPGNNDLPDEIARLAPEAEVYPWNTPLTIDGVPCRVGHPVSKMTFDTPWSFYGHGLTGETWRPEDNRPGQPCRFNVSYGSFVCCLSEGKFFHIPRP